MIRIHFVAASILLPHLAVAAPLPSNIEGSDSCKYTSHAGLSCYIYPKYTVQTRKQAGEALGESIQIYKRSTTTDCGLSIEKPWMEFSSDQTSDKGADISNGQSVKAEPSEVREPRYFDGISGEHLFIGRYTSNSGIVDVYNLNTQKRAYSVTYDAFIRIESNRYLVYDRFLGPMKNGAECPDESKSSAQGTGLAARMSLDLRTGREREEKRFCRYFE